MRAIKLTEQFDGNRFMYFCKSIGGKRFTFNQSRHDSEQRAALIIELFDAVVQWCEPAFKLAQGIAKGAVVVRSGFATRNDGVSPMGRMTPEEIEQLVARITSEVVRVQQQPQQPKNAKGLMLYAAIDQYLADYLARVTLGRYIREHTAMSVYKSFQPDCLLADVDADRLRETVNHFRMRPTTRTGLSMAVATVQAQIKAIKALFDWLDMSDKWIAPRRFEKLFRVKYSTLRTPLEVKKESNGVETFGIDELKTLWSKATSRQRLYIGLALNIGETAQGIASLMKCDLDTTGSVWVIDRNRGKTGVRGVYPLWPEVQQLIAAEMNTDANEPLLFKTADGNALVWYTEKGRVDSIAKTWTNLLKKCQKVRKLGHKYLRKTGASIIEKLTSSDRVAEAYLSHKGQSVAKRHYLAQDFTRLATALVDMRQHLSPVFAAADAQKDTRAA